MFAAVIRGLEDAAQGPSRVRALGHNHNLWSALVKDLARDGNGLPAALKTQLIELGSWAMRYSTLALLKDLPVQPLIDVNRNIAEGLALQAAAAPAAAPASGPHRASA